MKFFDIKRFSTKILILSAIHLHFFGVGYILSFTRFKLNTLNVFQPILRIFDIYFCAKSVKGDIEKLTFYSINLISILNQDYSMFVSRKIKLIGGVPNITMREVTQQKTSNFPRIGF